MKPLKAFKKFNKKRLKRIILWTIGIIFGVIILAFIWYSKDLPTPGKIKAMRPIESTQIFDRNGNPLYDVHGEIKRNVITSEEIPEVMRQATVAAEDRDFYKHSGINFRGIARAIYVDIIQRGKVQGGSTITQQYVKNALLSSKKTFDRKIKELILSIELEAMYSKDEILTMYLNEIPYGSNAYGVQAAAQTYFGKDAKDLNLEEATLLASLPKAPTYYSPYGSHPDKLKDRREYVLDWMIKENYITQEKADESRSQDVNVVDRKENIAAPHFVFYVKEKLIEWYGEQMVEEGGLKVTTTLDLDKQKIAEEAVDNGYNKNIKKYGASNAALVSIDPKTGQILTMVGSHDFFDTDSDGQVNVTTSERQPGSSFKPIVYATGFKEKYNPAFTLWDVKTNFGNYTPNNYDGNTHGPVSIRKALANSLNIPAVKMLGLVGIDEALKTAHEMGITTLNEPERYGLALVLGGGEVKPLDMATAFGVFADQGTLAETTPFITIENSDEKMLYEYDEGKNKKEVLDPQIAYEISDILSDNDARNMVFGSLQHNLTFPDRPVAVKTGTTSEFRDAWTVGYTPSISTAVWVGNNDNTPMGNHADGSMAAAPIWHEFMEKILEGTPIEQFERPAGIEEVTVDKYSNKIPTSQSPETIKDIFASWQVPKEYDDIHIVARICQACSEDKLAGDDCPASQIEERTYTNLHSEKSDNPNWENPVQAVAQAMGIYTSWPPKEYCDVSSIKPTLTIISPQNKQLVSGNFDILTSVGSSSGIREVEFLIDNVSVAKVASNPYNTTYNANNLSTGQHTLSVKVTDNHDLTANNSITINIMKDTTASANVGGVNLTSSVSKTITINWTNPNDSDLITVRIYVSTVSGNIGVKNTDVTVTPNTTTSRTITNLVSGTRYYFTLHPIDNSGNENDSVTQYSAIAM